MSFHFGLGSRWHHLPLFLFPLRFPVLCIFGFHYASPFRLSYYSAIVGFRRFPRVGPKKKNRWDSNRGPPSRCESALSIRLWRPPSFFFYVLSFFWPLHLTFYFFLSFIFSLHFFFLFIFYFSFQHYRHDFYFKKYFLQSSTSIIILFLALSYYHELCW